MSRIVFSVAFAVGLAAVAWVGSGFVGTSWLALVMTGLIAATYVLGAAELRRFRAATSTLATALADVPQALGDADQSGQPSHSTPLTAWLDRIDPSLRQPVRQRIDGERVALPGPALTPYLVGLLVMLGMLGTFLGMVVTFKGAVFALEGSTDLHAIRAALAEPIKGLSLSFGTSVAGVAASAMLGLMSALSRRERVAASRLLDAQLATTLRPVTMAHQLAHQRDATLRSLQALPLALPQVVQGLQALADGLERRSQQLNEQLLAQQAAFHRDAQAAYTQLAQSVSQSLQDSLSASARVASDSLKPVLQQAMSEVAQESARAHQRLVDATQTQLDSLSAKLTQAAAQAQAEQAQADQHKLHAWTQALATLAERLGGEWQRAGAHALQQQQAVCDALERSTREVTERTGQQASQALGDIAQLLNQSEALIGARVQAEAQWVQEQGERMAQLSTLWRDEIGALRADEARRGDAAVARLGELQSAMAQHLATLGQALEAPMSRLMQTAADVPQAAAQVIAQLRTEMAQLSERDTHSLQERAAVMEQLRTLLQAINQASGEQRTAIESLAASAASVMEQASRQFADTLGAQAGKTEHLAAHVMGSAIELSTLGEAFNHGVQLFSGSNDKLVDGLQRMESAIQQSMARSDEQLAYYVAQAREVIDLSISAQQGIVEDLRKLHEGSARLMDQGKARGPGQGAAA